MEISARAAQLTPSLTLSIDSKAKAMKAEGIDVCGFGAGEPDFDTPEHIKAAAIAALEAGFTKYTPSARTAGTAAGDRGETGGGQPTQLPAEPDRRQQRREAFLLQRHPRHLPGRRRSADPLAVLGQLSGHGAPGRRRAGHRADDRAQRLEDARGRFRKRDDAAHEDVDPEQPGQSLPARSTRAKSWKAIVEVAAEEDIYILSDEIYEKLVYDDAQHVSIASLSQEAYDLTITVNGFSKAYAMTGWRLGYLAAPEAVAKAADNIQSHSTSHPCSFAQRGAVAALKGDQQPLADMRDEFNMRRNYMYDRITKIPNITAVKPEGAFYILVNISQLGLSSQNFADRLLSKANVAVDSRDRLRRRSHRAPQLRDQHRRHQEGSRSLPGFLPDAVTI